MTRRTKKEDQRWGDIDGGSAFIIPTTLLRHPNFKRLSAPAVKMLLDLGRQFTGFNNGYQCAAWTLSQHWGWKSQTTVRDALAELEHFKIMVRTRQGGRNRPNLYGLTFRRIDRKADNPLDVGWSISPSNEWKEEQLLPFVPAERKRKSSPAAGPRSTPSGSNVDPPRANVSATAPAAGPMAGDNVWRDPPLRVT